MLLFRCTILSSTLFVEILPIVTEDTRFIIALVCILHERIANRSIDEIQEVKDHLIRLSNWVQN